MNRSRLWFFPALILVVSSARSSRESSECPLHGTSAGNTVTGSSEVAEASAVYASNDGYFQLFATGTYASPSLNGDSVDFSFSFSQGKTQGPGDFVIACRAASWSTLATGASLSLRDLCGTALVDGGTTASVDGGTTFDAAGPTASLTLTLDDATTVAVFDLSAIDGTVTVTPELDGHGNGSISLTLDVPKAHLTSTTGMASRAPTVVDFSATALLGVATYADQAAECPDTGGDGCGCGSSGGYHPGGD